MADFAVIIPTRNRAAMVERLVQVVHSLEAAPDEIVVVDDGSTDGTAERLRRLSYIEVVEGNSDGPSAARNAGAALSTSDWLIFLDDDDKPDPDWMTAFRDLADANPDASHLSIGYRYQVGQRVTERRPVPLGPVFNHAVSSYLAGTFAVRRSLFDALGGFDQRLRYLEFTDLAVRLFESCGGAASACATDTRPHITYVGRPPSMRASQNPHVLAWSTRLVLQRTTHLWRRDPAMHANQLAIMGVALIRAGRGSEGGRILRRAARVSPRSLGHVARAVAGSVSPVRSRVWKAHVGVPPSITEGPLVSVVIPVYERQPLLNEAIRSVLRQTYRTLEVIVVDDGSPTPITVPDDRRIRLIRTANSGVAHARNHGAQMARGEYVFFLDSDDEYEPHRVSNAVAAHQSTSADIVVCGQSWDDGTSPFNRQLFGFVGDEILDDITPHLGATSIRRSRLIPFDERYLATQDVEWWLRIAQHNAVFTVSSLDCRIRRHMEQRHLNGYGARVEFGFQLLHDQSEYFATHPSAHSFRLARLALTSQVTGDSDLGLRLAARACRVRVHRASLIALVKASCSRVADIVSPEPQLARLNCSPISTAHARTWRPRVFGPPEARLVPLNRLQRVAGELAALLGSPWASYTRAAAAHLSLSGEVEIHSPYGRFRVSQHDHALLHPYFFETFESAIAARLIKRGMTVVDIGANRGWYTVMAAALVGSAGRVLAVEPDDRMRRVLQHNIALNRIASRVAVEASPVSDRSGSVAWVSATEGSLSHLAGPSEDDALTEKRSTTLEELLDRHRIDTPHFIKVDVEGAEVQVLAGCRFDRFAQLPVLMFEFQPDMIQRSGDDPRRLLEALWSAGYRILQVCVTDGNLLEVSESGGIPNLSLGRNFLAIEHVDADRYLADMFIPCAD